MQRLRHAVARIKVVRQAIAVYNGVPHEFRETADLNASDPASSHAHYNDGSKRPKLTRGIPVRPSRWILRSADRPVEVSVGRQIMVKMPARFAGYDWERYQSESVGAVVRWVRQNP